MKIPTLYLDTLVIGGYDDDEWKDATQELWRQMEAGRYRFVTSAVTTDELIAAPKRVRQLFTRTFFQEAVLGARPETESLAAAYMSRHIGQPNTRMMRAMLPPALWLNSSLW